MRDHSVIYGYLTGVIFRIKKGENRMVHGGDIYRNHIKLDFSVNVNPLGMPMEVNRALHEAVEKCQEYPDIMAEKLKEAMSAMLSVPSQYLLFGNGASELFMAVIHTIKPAKVLIPVPSFYGYEYAAKACNSEIEYYVMKEEEQFGLTEDFFHALTEDVDVLFLANPNNPTGKLLDREYLKALLAHCKEKGIYVVLDECFLDFCENAESPLSEIEAYEHAILIRAFTKIFAIPGVRLGYLINSSPSLLSRIKEQLPEWNLSVFAQKAGLACTGQQAYIEKTVEYVKTEKQYLSDKLSRLGFEVYPGEANFILIRSKTELYKKLLEQGILIRDCSNFRGLTKGYYRIAVKTREENDILLKIIEEFG